MYRHGCRHLPPSPEVKPVYIAREREKEPRCYIEMKWPDEGGGGGVV
jgi:hypothetical protein